MSTVIIGTDRAPVTVISTFTVEPAHQHELVTLLRINAVPAAPSPLRGADTATPSREGAHHTAVQA